MPKTTTPIFLFSLPRSGSTLVQRILASIEEVATTSEPWLLLPLVYSLRDHGVYAEYWHQRAIEAVSDFILHLPGQRDSYLHVLRQAALDLYTQASGDSAKYFLDKTPRYHLIIDEIFEIFEDAKFIFLWRNPLAIAASLVESWYDGRWCVYKYKVDFYRGMESLIRALEKYGSRAISVNFEKLILYDYFEWNRLFSYLDLSFDDDVFNSFQSVELNGRMGDKTGESQYGRLSSEPLEKWKRTFNSRVRKMWGQRYLRWIGPQRLQSIGYEMDDLNGQIEEISTNYRHELPDAFRTFFGAITNVTETKIYADKIKGIKQKYKIYQHR